MTKAIRRRPAGDEGFTLIEAVIVVMIIAVVIAIAIPAFRGFSGSAQNRAAQTGIRAALLSEKAVWVQEEEYTDDPDALVAFEPKLVFFEAGIAPHGVVFTLAEGDDQIVCIEALSASGIMFGVWESATEGTFYGSDRTGATLGCGAGAPEGWTQSGW